MSSTFSPRRATAVARWTVSVVFPTPPFWFNTAITRGMFLLVPLLQICDSSYFRVHDLKGVVNRFDCPDEWVKDRIVVLTTRRRAAFPHSCFLVNATLCI